MKATDCPICKSDRIKITGLASGIDDFGRLIIPVKCQECGHKFKEWQPRPQPRDDLDLTFAVE